MRRVLLVAIVLPACSGEPRLLSATGLFADGGVAALAPGVTGFAPRFALWSDGAEKERFLSLPDAIDASDPDAWVFPDDTRAWKTFLVEGVPIETRMLHKRGEAWTQTVYLWREDGSDAERVRGGVSDALGTSHDVPTPDDCASCHDHAPDGLLGLSSAQYDASDDALGGQVEPAQGGLALPGDDLDQRVLGSLDANCGSCHDARFGLDFTSLDLSLPADALGSVEDTPAWRTAVGVDTDLDPVAGLDATQRIAPGDPDHSLLYLRAALRGADGQMPPLASELPDEAFLADLDAWIRRAQ